ncbi:hypothetical protein [Breznakibacter xylanolyticus]|uniref:hypothetical protein n=1 Tax=Breznakibacter xylanolyticus TaxID=990 RepID=UPI000DAE3021|nr:hypothetical protein [Breznakibacter xylanolyticus]
MATQIISIKEFLALGINNKFLDDVWNFPVVKNDRPQATGWLVFCPVWGKTKHFPLHPTEIICLRAEKF